MTQHANATVPVPAATSRHSMLGVVALVCAIISMIVTGLSAYFTRAHMDNLAKGGFGRFASMVTEHAMPVSLGLATLAVVIGIISVLLAGAVERGRRPIFRYLGAGAGLIAVALSIFTFLGFTS